MKTFTQNNRTALNVACAIALAALSGIACAQSLPARDSSFVYDGNSVLMTASGLCVHTASGPAPASDAQCDPNFVPAPVAAAPAPQPVVVAAPRAAPVVAPAPAPIVLAAIKPTPVMVKVKLDADTLFDFDKAVLRATGRDSLDAFVSKVKDINPEVISAVGHTDRLGTPKYNQRLSEQRVEAVRTYLVSKGVAENRIHAEGKGESQPLAQTSTCTMSKSAKNIACLQPDRRVDIEVIGTRVQ